MWCVLHSKIVQSIKIFILVMVEGIVVDDARGIEKIFLSHVRAPLGSEVKSLKKVKKLTFSK